MTDILADETPEVPKKTCKTCGEEKPCTSFTVQSCNPRTLRKYYVSSCKRCNANNAKLKPYRYTPIPREQQQKRGVRSIVDTDPVKKARIEQMLHDQYSTVVISQTCGISRPTLYSLIRKGKVIARDHSSEEDESESETTEDNESIAETESDSSEDNRSIAVEPDISDDDD